MSDNAAVIPGVDEPMLIPGADEPKGTPGTEESSAMPGTDELTGAVKRDRYFRRFRSTVRSTFLSLVVVAAVAVLIAVLLLRTAETSCSPSRRPVWKRAMSSLSITTTTFWSSGSSRTRVTGSISTTTAMFTSTT